LKLLSEAYPAHRWKQDKFLNKQKKSSQWYLCKIVKDIVPPNIEVIEEYVHPYLKFDTGSFIVFDLYVSSMNLVFEYHGIQHYYHHHTFGNLFDQHKRDQQRRQACYSQGITYIDVPYWWKFDKESIVATLNKSRPDIVSSPEVIPFEYETRQQGQ